MDHQTPPDQFDPFQGKNPERNRRMHANEIVGGILFGLLIVTVIIMYAWLVSTMRDAFHTIPIPVI